MKVFTNTGNDEQVTATRTDDRLANLAVVGNWWENGSCVESRCTRRPMERRKNSSSTRRVSLESLKWTYGYRAGFFFSIHPCAKAVVLSSNVGHISLSKLSLESHSIVSRFPFFFFLWFLAIGTINEPKSHDFKPFWKESWKWQVKLASTRMSWNY